jgi:hypothetical protein
MHIKIVMKYFRKIIFTFIALVGFALLAYAPMGCGGDSGAEDGGPGDVETDLFTPATATQKMAAASTALILNSLGYDLDIGSLASLNKDVVPTQINCPSDVDVTLECIPGDSTGGAFHAEGSCISWDGDIYIAIMDYMVSFDSCVYEDIVLSGLLEMDIKLFVENGNLNNPKIHIIAFLKDFTAVQGESSVGLSFEEFTSVVDASLGLEGIVSSVIGAEASQGGEIFYCNILEGGNTFCDPQSPQPEMYCNDQCEEGSSKEDPSVECNTYCDRGCCMNLDAVINNSCVGMRDCEFSYHCDIFELGAPITCTEGICGLPCPPDGETDEEGCRNLQRCDTINIMVDGGAFWEVRFGLSPDLGICRCVVYEYGTECGEEGIPCDELGHTPDGGTCEDLGLECRDGCCRPPPQSCEVVCLNVSGGAAYPCITSEDCDQGAGEQCYETGGSSGCWCCFTPDENCYNGRDDDGDELVDCDDPDCIGNPGCIGEVCNNIKDDDLDGFPDCKDVDCAGYPGCENQEICNDPGGLDEDEDALANCDDPDCSTYPPCQP